MLIYAEDAYISDLIMEHIRMTIENRSYKEVLHTTRCPLLIQLSQASFSSTPRQRGWAEIPQGSGTAVQNLLTLNGSGGNLQGTYYTTRCESD